MLFSIRVSRLHVYSRYEFIRCIKGAGNQEGREGEKERSKEGGEREEEEEWVRENLIIFFLSPA